MNKANLQQLFDNYVEHYDRFNRPGKEANETYKWHIVQEFQDAFDLEEKDFVSVLKGIDKITSGLLKSNYSDPVKGLIDFAEKEEETVRILFRNLYEEDGGDLSLRQKKIDQFIIGTEKLREKYLPESFKYEHNAKIVLTYLFLNDPEHNYLFKPTEANQFADCVEFYDDWGTVSYFKMPAYYRMCDEIVAEMKQYEPLMKKHQERFVDETLYKDPALHVLCFDMIYATQKYGLNNNISYKPLTSKEKQEYRNNQTKAQELLKVYEEAVERKKKLDEAEAHLNSLVKVGAKVCNKGFGGAKSLGKGSIVGVKGKNFTVCYDESGKEVTYVQPHSIANGSIIFEEDGLEEYADLLKKAKSIKDGAESAEKALIPYRNYL